MNNNINQLKNTIYNILLNEIDISYRNEAKVTPFILIILVIDCLGSYYKGEKASKDTFTSFMNDFNILKNCDPERVYKLLRNGLAHNLTIHQNEFILCFNKKNNHLKKTNEKSIIINFENLYNDFKDAIKLYFDKLSNDKNLQNNFTKIYPKNKIIGERIIESNGDFNNNGFDDSFNTLENTTGYGRHTNTSLKIYSNNDEEKK